MAYRCFLSFLPSSFNHSSFAVCGTFPTSERSVRSRPSFTSRLANINTLIWIGFAVYASVPLFVHHLSTSWGGQGPSAVWLFPGPVLKLVDAILKLAVPIRYMLFPPTMPPRDSMLFVDEQGIRRVKQMWKDQAENKEEWAGWGYVVGIELACCLILFGWI